MSGIIQDPSEPKPKPKRAPRAKKEPAPAVPFDPLVPGEAPAKPKRASRAKPKPAAAETLPEDDAGNVEMPELSREVSFAFGTSEAEAKPKPRKSGTSKPKAEAVAKAAPMPSESPKWLKFKADVEAGKWDFLREDGGFHPGKLSIQVSKILGSNPEFRPLVAELLRSRGRQEVMRIFSL